MDGANAWQRFWHVTWPLLKPVTLVVVVFSIIQTFSDFQLIYVLTGGGPANAVQGHNVTPNAQPLRILPLEPQPEASRPAATDDGSQARQMAAQFGIATDDSRPRTVLSFSQNANDLLLSGSLSGAQGLTGKAALLDATVGKGHVVMFAMRPFWRWQTQGTYAMGFNAILHWNDLNAGR